MDRVKSDHERSRLNPISESSFNSGAKSDSVEDRIRSGRIHDQNFQSNKYSGWTGSMYNLIAI